MGEVKTKARKGRDATAYCEAGSGIGLDLGGVRAWCVEADVG